MLKKIDPQQIELGRPTQIRIPKPVICEACGKIVERRDYAINVMILVGSPGHPDLPSFQCIGGEDSIGDSIGDHWACSVECWLKVTHACIDEHIVEILKYHRSKKGLS